MKLNLNNVTLICVDDLAPKESANLFESLSARISFGDLKLLSSRNENYITDKIKPINSLTDYSHFIINDLHKYVNTEFCMTIQRDGYPINLDSWTDDYLKYDYIGAPWIWSSFNSRKETCPDGKCVGNGGFSLRSKKILEETPKYIENFKKLSYNEDDFICKIIGDELKSVGIKFPTVEVADLFSVENTVYRDQFGFHGIGTIIINKRLGLFKFEKNAYESEHKK